MVAVVLSTTSGCSGGDCTLIGCLGVLAIAFDVSPSGPYQLELLSTEFGKRTFNCTDAAGNCAPPRFEEYTPDLLVATMTTGTGTRQMSIAPVYSNSYPNGPRCGVTCRSATVTLRVP